MTTSKLGHVTDEALLASLQSLLHHGHQHTARLLAHLGEVDHRSLFAAQGHPSMFRFCVDRLHMSEGTAYKRICSARVARRHPQVLAAIAEGRLHLSGVVLLAPHLNVRNVDDLLEAATHRSKSQIEHLLAERFPKPDLPTSIRRLTSQVSGNELSPGTVAMIQEVEPAGPVSLLQRAESLPVGIEVVTSAVPTTPSLRDATDPTPQTLPATTSLLHNTKAPQTRVTPTAPERYALQTTLDAQAHEDLRAIQAMLSHVMPSHDLGAVLGRALAMCRAVLEKQRTRETQAPRPHRCDGASPARHIPAAVRRAVWQRDGHRCTFIGPESRRCESRSFLELDHVLPVARGGRGTVDNLRVRCRAHNQLEAERVFGVAFMHAQREHAHAARTRSA